MKNLKLKSLVIALACVVAFSCAKDEASNEDYSFGTGTAGAMLTPTEQQAKLNEIGVTLLSSIDTTKLQATADGLMNVIGKAMTIETIPESLLTPIYEFVALLSQKELMGFADYLTLEQDSLPILDFTEFYGTYTLSNVTGMWSVSSNTSGAKFIIDDYVLNIVTTGSVYVSSSTGNYQKLPSKVKVTFTGEDAIDFGFELNITAFDFGNKLAKTNLNLTLNDLTITMSESLENGSGSATAKVSMGSTELMYVAASVGDFDFDIALDTEQHDSLSVAAGQIAVDMRLMKSLYISGGVANLSGLIEDLEALEDKTNTTYHQPFVYNGDINDTYRLEAYYDQQDTIYNNYLSLSWNFDNSTQKVGYLYFGHKNYAYDYKEADADSYVVMKFDADASSYMFEEFFVQTAFTEVIEALTPFINIYGSMMQD